MVAGNLLGYQRVAVRVSLASLPRGSVGHRPGHSGTATVPGGEVNAVKRSAVSTGQLSALLHVHTPPIDLVIFQEPVWQSHRRPHLAEGFTLRCLQRLSRPHVTTRRCRERDNRDISGASLPILSY